MQRFRRHLSHFWSYKTFQPQIMGSCLSKMDVFGCCLHTIPSPEPTLEPEAESLLKPNHEVHAERNEHDINREPNVEEGKVTSTKRKKVEAPELANDKVVGQSREITPEKDAKAKQQPSSSETEKQKEEKRKFARLFVAVELTEQFKQAAQESMSDLQADPRIIAAGRALRWVRPEGLHITLKFLGEVEEARVDGITGALREAVEKCGQVHFLLRGLGMGLFPEAKKRQQQPLPRVLWLGLGPECQKPLERLQSAVDGAMVGQGFQPEKGPFNSHITLARIDGGKNRKSKNQKPKRKIDLSSGEEQPNSTTVTQAGITRMELDESAAEIPQNTEHALPENASKKAMEKGGNQVALRELCRLVERIQSYSAMGGDMHTAENNSGRTEQGNILVEENSAMVAVKVERNASRGNRSGQEIADTSDKMDLGLQCWDGEREARERWQGRWGRMDMCVTKVSLMRSELGRGGARYTALDTFELPVSSLSVVD